MGLGNFLESTGQVYGELDKNVNDAYRRGQVDVQSAQLNALRERQLNQAALRDQLQRSAATQAPAGIMGAPNINQGYTGQFDMPPPIQAPPPGRAPGTFSQEEIDSARASDMGLPAPTRQKVDNSGKITPPIGFAAPMPPPRPTTAPGTPGGGQMPPYGAPGRGMTRNFGPVTPKGNTQGDVRKFDNETNPVIVKPLAPTPNIEGMSLPRSADNRWDTYAPEILMQEIADNPDQEGAIGKELGYMQDAQRRAGNPNVGLPVPPPSEPPAGIRGLQAPGEGASGSHSIPQQTPNQAPMGQGPQGTEFFGGQQGGNSQQYSFYDQLANQQSKMAQIHMLAGDPDRANSAIAQANMARLEQYNILSAHALNSARRGDPTQLLSLMNFYDPGAAYSLRAMGGGSVQVLSNGQVIGTMPMTQFLDSAQMMTSKAYSDQMTALKSKLYEEYMKQGFQGQREMGVEDVKGRWHVEAMKAAAQSKGLKIVVDSASGHVFATDANGGSYTYQEGVPIAGSKFPTAGSWIQINQ